MDTVTVSPCNVENITIQVFFMRLRDIKKKYIPQALPYTDKLIQAWSDYSKPKINDYQKKERALMRAAKRMISILKPSAQQRLIKLQIQH
jgi:hypothetical protein